MIAQSGLGQTIFLCGDVMTGRGVDQILPHPGDPTLREPMADARSYVTCAEEASGPIPRPADFAWPWGEALTLVEDFAPDVRSINLETTITADGEFARGKLAHHRMHPDNMACLTAIRPDACALAKATQVPGCGDLRPVPSVAFCPYPHVHSTRRWQRPGRPR